MRTQVFRCSLFPSLLVYGPLLMAGQLKSGPQIGASLPGPVHALIVIHAEKPDAAGKKWDFVEQYGQTPVVVVFARTMSDPLAHLLKKVDAEVAKHNMDNKMLRALVVMMSVDDSLEQKLKDIAEKYGIKHVSLAIDTDHVAGSSKWNLIEDVDVTIVLYNRRKVEANHAFRKGELNEKTISTVIADLPKIVGR